MTDNVVEIEKDLDIDLELVETALLALQICAECGFYFFIELQEGEFYNCPNCLEVVAYSEDHPYFVKL